MTYFHYKDLSKFNLLKYDFLIAYTRELQAHAQALEKELYDSFREVSTNGNHYYQEDAKRATKALYDCERELAKAQRELILTEAKKDMEIERLMQKVADQEQTIERLKESQVVEVLPVDHRRGRMRDERGMYISDAEPLEFRMKQAYNLIEVQGYSAEQAGYELNISPQSAIAYKNKYKRLQDASRIAQNASKTVDKPRITRLCDCAYTAPYMVE